MNLIKLTTFVTKQPVIINLDNICAIIVNDNQVESKYIGATILLTVAGNQLTVVESIEKIRECINNSYGDTHYILEILP